MLRLDCPSYQYYGLFRGKDEVGHRVSTYPDSVNRVSPPKTTIPKTLAALASSQYATVFEDASGKNDFFLLPSPSGPSPAPFSSLPCAFDCVSLSAVAPVLDLVDSENARGKRLVAWTLTLAAAAQLGHGAAMAI